MRRLSPMMMVSSEVGLHPVEGRANDPGARLADIEGLLTGHPLDGAHSAAGWVHQGPWVSGLVAMKRAP